MVGGTRFYDRLEIKDILGYLKLSINPSDDVAFKRVINVPTRGLGKTTLERLEELSVSRKMSLFETSKSAVDHREFNAGTTSKLRAFVQLIADLNNLASQFSLLDFYHLVLEKTEYLNRLRSDESAESDARIENLEELSNAMSQFIKERPQANLALFLEEMALVSDIDSLKETTPGVVMMTLHVSKGLEFPNVFIVGLEENLFPSGRSDDEDEESSMEEERRLAYVGMTRARARLYLSYAKTRKVWGQDQYNPPSRFLKEIPENLVQFSTAMNPNSFAQRAMGVMARSYSPAPRNLSRDSDFDVQTFPEDEFSDSKDYQQGQKVRHPTFGAGSIYQVEGSGDQQKVSVLFADQTIKKFVVKYARLEKF
jgi:DNA helicase-2/ATP-dependent DNA helicase PcrA